MADDEYTEAINFKVTRAISERLDAQCSPKGLPKRSRSEILRWCLEIGLGGLEASPKWQCLRCNKVYESIEPQPFCDPCTAELKMSERFAKTMSEKKNRTEHPHVHSFGPRGRAQERVLLLASRWARFMEELNPKVMAAPTHHLLRAIQKLEQEP